MHIFCYKSKLDEINKAETNQEKAEAGMLNRKENIKKISTSSRLRFPKRSDMPSETKANKYTLLEQILTVFL